MLIEAYEFHVLIKALDDYRKGRSEIEPQFGPNCFTSGFIAMHDRNGELCFGIAAEGIEIAYRGPGFVELNESLRLANPIVGQRLAVLFCNDGHAAQAARPVSYCAVDQEIGKTISNLLDYNRFDEADEVVPEAEQWAPAPEWF